MLVKAVFYNPSDDLILPEEEAHHAVNVLRLRNGDRITVLDGKGNLYECTLESTAVKNCTYTVAGKTPVQARSFRLQLAFGILKSSDRMEWMVEKAVEIGVDEISPVISDHCERKKVNLKRMEKTIVAAMKQSIQPYMPVLNPPLTLDEFISTHIPGYIAHCNEGPKLSLRELDQSINSVNLLIGPEGDFTVREIEKSLAAGWRPVTLGESRLRTETAAVVACHAIHLLKD